MYLIFDTPEEAEIAQDTILNLAMESVENAAYKQQTTRYANPVLTVQGKWAIPYPTGLFTITDETLFDGVETAEGIELPEIDGGVSP